MCASFYTTTIKLDTINKVKEFVSIVQHIQSEVTIESNNAKINGKSVMGIFSLNILEPLLLTIEDISNIDKESMSRIEKLKQ